MNSLFKRMTALVLCLCLLCPCLALADDDYAGYRFRLNAEMNADAYPKEDASTLSGIAELVNRVSVEGELDRSFTSSFEMNADVILDGAEETRTSFRLYGMDSHWGLQSSLLGEETLMFNMEALLEFAMKIYFHMDIPLQRLALLVSRYAHTSAFAALYSAWRGVMQSQEGARNIAKEDILTLAEKLAGIAETDRAFIYWVEAVALEAGYDDVIMDVMASLPEWAEEFIDEEGVTVSIQGGTETWRTGGTTLFTRTISDTHRETWALTLPATLDGYTLTASYRGEAPGNTLSLALRIDSEYDGTLLDARVEASALPLSLPISEPFTLTIDATGETVGEEGFHTRFEGNGRNGAFDLRQVNAATGETMLTISGVLEECVPATRPSFGPWDVAGVNVFSLNDYTLNELLQGIKEPMLNGLIPLLLHIPASSFQSIMDLLTDSGILGALATGSLTGESVAEPDEGWDEDEEWDEEWDNEEYDVEAEPFTKAE